MNKRDKKRLAARVSEVPHQRDWDEWERDRDLYYRHRRPEPLHVPEKSPYRSDAEKIALLGGVMLLFLLGIVFGQKLMGTDIMIVQILGFVLWLASTGLLLSLVGARLWYDLLRPLWRRLRRG